jgi:hypothetical protein
MKLDIETVDRIVYATRHATSLEKARDFLDNLELVFKPGHQSTLVDQDQLFNKREQICLSMSLNVKDAES